MKRWGLVACLVGALCGSGSADQLKTVFNPFTGKPDYINASVGGGGASTLEVMSDGLRVSSPTASINLRAGSNLTLTSSLVGGATASVLIDGPTDHLYLASGSNSLDFGPRSLPFTGYYINAGIGGLALSSQNGFGQWLIDNSGTQFQGNIIVSSSVLINNSPGSANQCLLSQGDGSTPIWATCPGGSGGGIVSPGTFTWTNTQGLVVSTVTLNGIAAPAAIGTKGIVYHDSTEDWLNVVEQGAAYGVLASSQTSGITPGHVAVFSSTNGAIVDGGVNGGQGNAILNQSTLQAGATAFPDFLYVNSTMTVYGASVMHTTFTVYGVASSLFYNVSSMTLSNAPLIVDSITINTASASQWLKTDATSNVVSGNNTERISYVLDGGGIPISSGTVSLKRAHVSPFAATISSYTFLCDSASSSISVTISTETYAQYAAGTAPGPICASACPSISNAYANTGQLLTNWTTSLNAGDVVVFDLTGAAPLNATWCNLELWVNKQ